QALLPGVRVGLVHGRLKAAEKLATMVAFKAGEIDLLVATTVIEVGVDVPNASLMVIENAERLGLDPQRLAIGGDSAGGNLAAACCLLLRELGLPQPCHQLLLYPALDADMDSDSYRDYAAGYYLSAELMQRCWQAYLGDLAEPPALASPAHATDLKGLAPASVLS
ncbi:alpha/beta hydrolase fold domain-containing protein, partial [Stenotrophomonas maltophilia]|nr:alpha/beta hydrolase fold domain-containing protein [Stenotrophomonas maltophilia]